MSWGLDSSNQKVMNQSMEIEYCENIPKQHNTFDCGIYIMSFAESLVMNYIQSEGSLRDLKYNSAAMLAHIDQVYIFQKRIEIRNILFEMIKKHSDVYDFWEISSHRWRCDK